MTAPQTSGVLIGLGGWQKSGKDTLADFLVDDHGYFKTFFSEALNEALLTLNPIVAHRQEHDEAKCREIAESLGTSYSPDALYMRIIRYSDIVAEQGYTQAKENLEVRRLLRMMGTEVGRKMFGEDVWTDIIERKIRDAWAAGKPVVVTGVRYPNELERIRALGGTVAWVKRPGIDLDPAHTSETSLSEEDFDFTVNNDSDLDTLREIAIWVTDNLHSTR
jgi:hypothetical protein